MKKTNILIVDDDPDMTETMADIFMEMGYDVAVARDGYRAIEMIKKEKYDIALIDIKMPGINGIKTFQKIKQFDNPPRAILMTAYSIEDLIEKAWEEGVYAVVYKPLNIEKLVTLVKNIEKELEVDTHLAEFFSGSSKRRG